MADEDGLSMEPVVATGFTPIFNVNYTCSIFDGDQTKCNIIRGVKDTVSVLSMIGCLFIICVIGIFKKYIVLTQRMILYLSVAAFLQSVCYLMAAIHPHGLLCTFKAWAMTFMDWAVLLWVCCLTINLYMNAVRMQRTDHLEWVYHLISWGVPLLISLIPVFGNAYGPAGMWCWEVDDWRWRFGTWYIPLFFIIFMLFVTYTFIVIMVKRKAQTWEGHHNPDIERQKKMLAEDVKPLLAYPFVYLIISIFPLINRIQNAVSPSPVFALTLLAILFSPLGGAVYAIVFGLDKETTSRLRPSMIKVALLNRYRGENLVREYPTFTGEDTPTSEPNIPDASAPVVPPDSA